ncbi:MAG: hypothetical protein J6X10_06930 [Bacteroidales bacterium]|nr:hypothetical protein [Bacteroidales bacterium]
MEENNQIPTFTDQENPKPVRPFGLSFICVLSFINAVWQFIINFLAFAMFNTMKTVTTDENYADMMENLNIDMDQMETNLASFFAPGKFYYLLTALIYIGSFFGVLYMWRLQKKGFHIYTIAQVLLLIVMVLMFTSVTGASPWSNVVFTAIFIGLYFIYYRKSMN